MRRPRSAIETRNVSGVIDVGGSAAAGAWGVLLSAGIAAPVTVTVHHPRPSPFFR